ncbi:hypothetical protein K503DRAFT_714294 [Rhizopogon vinicolor AM-OR11-026]|uniref:tRNA-guanine(15) transglycosylase-like domain-containing protein n=1 Tax=Rhizopogon vinicolor AM-OR11-026 TaxID=1314800 RepID=A0A1B7N6X0_9AGAM|nr:hypothetical protein K503DRAFT_714294 [Rhizopogon vinicolor AM-OR11-026]
MAKPPAKPISIYVPKLTFTLDQGPQFGPRIGRLCLTQRSDRPSNHTIDIPTPNFLIGTSRGVVPHLSRDHVHSANAISWINVPFESFLEHTPPVPTQQTGSQPLHDFLGFDSSKHIVSLSLRDPLDAQEMPPNGNTHISALCMRGVKKVTLADWRSYVLTMQPDIAFALSDTPFTAVPHSQKRITKSIERSTAWLADLLRPFGNSTEDSPLESTPTHPLNVFVHMAGGASISARKSFSHNLTENLHGLEADAVNPLRCLDDGVAGYAFDLATLRMKPVPISVGEDRGRSIEIANNSSIPQDLVSLAEMPTPNTTRIPTSFSSSMNDLPSLSLSPTLGELLRVSLNSLPIAKPRLITDVRSPHEILRLVRDVGIDVYDAGWVVKAADVGVALDFIFPIPSAHVGLDLRKRDIGHNLYDSKYAGDFTSVTDAFLAGRDRTPSSISPICPCIACSPVTSGYPIHHSKTDVQSHQTHLDDGVGREPLLPPFTRSYLHHLLHTHEMSAHTFLVAHNVAVLDALFTGVRTIISGHADQNEAAAFFAREVTRFEDAYDEALSVLHTARDNWNDVKQARGKGRLARESGKTEGK